HHGEDGLLRNADNLEPVSDGDVVEVGKRPRQRDLGAARRPVAPGNAELPNVASRVVAGDGGHHILVSTRLKLHVCGTIWTGVRRGSDQRGRAGERARVDPAVEPNLQVSALLRLERQLVRVTRLRD